MSTLILYAFHKFGILSLWSYKILTICPDYFFCFIFRIEEITPLNSKLIWETLKENKILNENDFLQSDPRRSKWRNYLKSLDVDVIAGDSLIADASPISEVLNVAWAYHELTATRAELILDFFESSSEFCKNTIYCAH